MLRRHVLTGIAASLLTGRARAQDADKIVIGVVAPRTGDNASYGKKIVEATQAWVAMINDQGGIYKHIIDLHIEDDAGEPKNARQTAQRIIDAGATAVVGHGLTGTTKPVIDMYHESNILHFINTNSGDLVLPDTAFQILPQAQDFQQKMVEEILLAVRQTGQNIFVLTDDSDYSRALSGGILKLLPTAIREAGLNVKIETQSIGNNNEIDFNAVVSRMKEASAGVVVMALTVPGQAGSIVYQAAQQGYHPQVIGGGKLTFEEFYQHAGQEAAHATAIAFPGLVREEKSANPGLQKLRESFRKYGVDVTDVGIGLVDALDMLKQAIEKSESLDAKKLSDYIRAHTFLELAGPMHFDAGGHLMGADKILVTYGFTLLNPMDPNSPCKPYQKAAGWNYTPR